MSAGINPLILNSATRRRGVVRIIIRRLYIGTTVQNPLGSIADWKVWRNHLSICRQSSKCSLGCITQSIETEPSAVSRLEVLSCEVWYFFHFAIFWVWCKDWYFFHFAIFWVWCKDWYFFHFAIFWVWCKDRYFFHFALFWVWCSITLLRKKDVSEKRVIKTKNIITSTLYNTKALKFLLKFCCLCTVSDCLWHFLLWKSDLPF